MSESPTEHRIRFRQRLSPGSRLRLVLYTTTLASVAILVPIRGGVGALASLDLLVLCLVLALEVTIIEVVVRRLQGFQTHLSAQAAELGILAEVPRCTTNAVIITDAQRRITWVNEGFSRITGYTLEEVRGMVPGDLLRCDDTDQEIVSAMSRALSDGCGFVGEIWNRAKHGQKYRLFIDIQPIRDSQGLVCGYSEIHSVISGRNHIDAAQAGFDSELHGFFQSSSDLLCIARIDGTLLRVNDSWTNALGTDAENIQGHLLADFLHPDDVDAAHAWFQQIGDGESKDGMRTRCRSGNGVWRTFEWRASARNGLIYGVARDVSDQLLVEQATLEQAERMELALAGGDIGTWDWDVPTGELSVDERWAEMIGESVGTVGDSIEFLSSRVHPADLTPCLERLRCHFEEGVPYQDVAFRLKHRDGSWRWIKSSGRVVSWADDGEPIRMVGIHVDVTQSIQRERERDEAKQRAELALRAGQMGLWDWDFETGELHCDQRWATTLGEWANDLASDAATLLTRIHEDDLPDFERAVQRHVDGASTHIAVRCRMRHRDGSWRWVHLFGTSAKCSDSDSGRLVGIQMDIHDSVVAEMELARREALLASTVRMTGVGGWEYDLVDGSLYWSDQVLAIHELPADYQPCVAEAISFYSGEDREKVTEHFERLVETGVPFDIECRFITAKGRHRWVRWVGEPVYRDGQIIRVVGAFQDITDQRNQREDIEAANQALEAAQAIARMGSWALDCASGEVRWSKQLFEIFEEPIEHGAPSYEAVLSHYLAQDAKRLEAAIRRAMERGTPYKLTLERANPTNGVRFVTVDGVARFNEYGKVAGLMGTVRDVTTEFEREATLREAQARAEVASQAKSDFLANMSHEIRTPMTSIIGFADLLSEPGLSQQQQAEYASTIRRNGEHLLNIINDILDISKIEAGQMATERIAVDPREVLDGVIDLMRIQATTKGLELNVEVADGLPERVKTDPTRLRQILVNLIGNAIKFTQSGGVRVFMDYGHDRDAAGVLAVRVADTGIGMDDDQARHIFEAFTQADASMSRRFGGTGLGLRISKKLAELLGGDIKFESEPGKGTTFTVTVDAGQYMPAESGTTSRVQGDATEVASSSSEAEIRPLDGVRILLMEDGIDNIRLITMHLERSGAHVTTALEGSEGLALLTADGSTNGPLRDHLDFDVILSDMQMPNLDGYTAVRILRDMGCTLPVIALTAHSTTEDRQRCMAAGCDAYATKPIGRDALVGVILNSMAQRQAA